MIEKHISLEFPFNRPDSVAIVGDLTLHCAHIQNQKEVVITANPNFTNFTEDLVESVWGASNRLLIFDIHKKETRSIEIDGQRYKIEFKTWSKVSDGVLRFDFIVTQL